MYRNILYQLVTILVCFEKVFASNFWKFYREISDKNAVSCYCIVPVKLFETSLGRSIFKASTAASKFYYNLPNTGEGREGIVMNASN